MTWMEKKMEIEFAEITSNKKGKIIVELAQDLHILQLSSCL